jgi:AcrR family transcriptional regulator
VTKRDPPYHHGALPRAVLDGALAAIEETGPAGLSLREVARRAGVSHSAPLHHFGDKAGVLTAIAAEGFRLLAEATRTALSTGDEFLEGALAYVHFAIAHRAHFAVMFTPALYRTDDAALTAARADAAQVLFDGVQGFLGPGREHEVLGGVLAIWSFSHGFATLWLSQNFETDADDTDAAVRLAAQSVARLVEAGAFPKPE